MKAIMLGFGLSVFLASTVTHADSQEKKPNDWLLGAKSDTERFESLQTYLRGFDQPMWEVGERFRAIHEALGRSNFELAAYHWEKIRVTIKNGYLKRPARRANSDAILLNATWGDVNEAFGSKNAEQAWAGFEKAKTACMACHAAESVPFMNNQALFDLSKPD
ncbi:hypothetical protein [Methylomonas rivi]|uniref:Cytochrome c domain-containing protein n=1 Tax=Methylomonas rivi TaxID=2952226 RepID=A0ABT1U6B4_9GAMM|nr:hypothetical protein [Methylomonas sp. WSC-6]MCQ8128915.1 hypothetical protein [Methylomonas sp. WSC-6]